jgi:murein L,D-transpeptidase YcbB/YkuD
MKTFLAFLFFSLSLSTCRMCQSEKPKADIVVKPEEIDAHVNEQIANQLHSKDTSGSLKISGKVLLAKVQVRNVYKTNEKESYWTHFGKLNAQADTFLSILHHAPDYGLLPKDYHVPLIDSLLRSATDQKTKAVNAVNLAESDILLTDAFFVFATHLNKGRLRSDTALPAFNIKELPFNTDSLFLTVHKNGNFRQCFDSIEPKQEQYHLLKAELKKFRLRWESHPWDTIPRDEKDTAALNRALKKMLTEMQDYDSTLKGNDSVKISKALKVFQKRFYLETDGKLGKNTLRLLHMSTSDRIRQIEMNMERWRQEPVRYPKRYILINIPQFEMKLMDDDTLFMQSRVVVGLPDKPTPLLASQLQYIMLYPYWNVPNSIATKEMLPILKRDTSYLRKKNFDVMDYHGNIIDPATINWSKYSVKYLPYRFRQREGEDNSLGIMKFNFNNKYGVYLHDTNSKRFFKRDVRALSHGCMRLENYMELAKYLIRDDSVKYPVDSLLTDILKEKQKQINLKKQIPIYTKYFSAIVDEKEGLMLFMDIYRRDELMEKVLY